MKYYIYIDFFLIYPHNLLIKQQVNNLDRGAKLKSSIMEVRSVK